MAFCGQCGFENPEGAKFCGNCGATLTQPATDDTPVAATEETPPVETPSAPLPPQPPTIPTSAEPPTTPEPPTEPEFPTAPAPPTALEPPIAPEPPTTASTPPNETPPTQPQKKGMGGKGCIGCGCAAVLIFLLVLGGLGWWGYSYMQDNGMDLDEVLESITGNGSDNDDDKDYGSIGNIGSNGSNGSMGSMGSNSSNGTNDNESHNKEEGSDSSNSGRKLSMSEVAQQNGFPYVTYDERPKEGPVYMNESGSTTMRFNYMRFKNDNSIGVMTINDIEAGQAFTLRLKPCGHSIYHMTDPNKAGMEKYVFVDRGGKRILVGGTTPPMELTLGY
ncbi:MAG: zinc ribbon domain-containing protein [Bacteroidaceae bacterium]|nr:zinc ribbon domain-containing protein [Bacteroidaceae bacterium]